MQNFTFLLIALFVSGNIYAQHGIKMGVSFTPGVSFSLNNEDLDKGTTLDMESAFAFNSGVTIGYGLTEMISISTGVIYNQHTANFVHKRERFTNTFGNEVNDVNKDKKISRKADYIRVPILFEVHGDPNRSAGFFFRIGPHFDFLASAVYKDERLIGFSKYDEAAGIDLSQEITLYEENSSSSSGISKTGEKGKIYNDFVIGVTMEIGAQFRINDHFKMTFLLHMETSSNPEGKGAASFAYNLDRGDRIVTSTAFNDPTASQADIDLAEAQGTPFDAMFPNYIDENSPHVTHRAPTWNIMGGLQIGIVYTLRPE